MSRRKRNAEEIQKPENYFNRYIALEIQKDWARDRQYYDRYVSLDALLEGKKMGNHKYRILPACNLGGEDYETHIVESDVFVWIESIEHPGLLEAILELEYLKINKSVRLRVCLSTVRRTSPERRTLFITPGRGAKISPAWDRFIKIATFQYL